MHAYNTLFEALAAIHVFFCFTSKMVLFESYLHKHTSSLVQLVPVELVRAYQRAMLNIHPSLLPAFGGKGFYGDRVHK